MNGNTPTPHIAQQTPSTTPRSRVIVSNRLPTSLEARNSGWISRPSSGGLASALSGITQGDDVIWVGWPGCAVPCDQQPEVIQELAERNLHPVFLRQEQEAHYYHGISNHVVWPLFHYFTDKIDFSEESWSHFVEVNRQFAEQICAVSAEDAQVWVHDFHLMLVPQMLRAMRPDLQIGFFLHIPFPSSEIYRLLPAREECIRGILGADYIGFHTDDYARHFRSSCLRILGVDSTHDTILHEGRKVGLGVNPIGIDVDGFDTSLSTPATRTQYQDLERRYGDRKLILGVERLDYTKGIRLKLRAFERYLERHPDQADKVALLQVLVPSRLDHPEYRELKRDIEEHVGRINGRFGGPGFTPVEYIHRGIEPEQLAALYRYADACLVTPIRDGMNLVAQEFVLCQGEILEDDKAYKGMLILSEFAGAAKYLPRSLLINPWDTEQTMRAIETALAMPAAQKEERLAPMVSRVRTMDCRNWATEFLTRLTDASHRRRSESKTEVLNGDCQTQVQQRCADAEQRVIFLDYDGTLRELFRTPEEAAPTQEILDLLEDLAELPGTEIHLVSGRKRSNLEEWFGHLPIHLSAEHGFCHRKPQGQWIEATKVDMRWIPVVSKILEQVTEEVAGTYIERKPCGLAWHYRMADSDYGVWRARELHSVLEQDLAHLPVDILHGNRVIEIHAAGIDKGVYVERILEGYDSEAFILCMGDDRTDLDMYRVLPANAVSVHIGDNIENTRFSLPSPQRVREFLRELAQLPVSSTEPDLALS